MRAESEALGLEGKDEDFGEEADDMVEGEQATGSDGETTDIQRPSEPPRTPTLSSSPIGVLETPEDTSELPTPDPSPEPDHMKTKKRSKKNANKTALEPLSKTERRALRRNQEFGSDGDEPEPNGCLLPGEGEEEAQAPVAGPSKRDKRRAKQAKKAESTATASKDVCYSTFQGRDKTHQRGPDSLQCLQ